MFAVNFFVTLLKRREQPLYVTLCFYIASIVSVTILPLFNNLSVPSRFSKSYGIDAGAQDAFMRW